MPRGYARRFKNYSTRPSLFHEFVPLFNDKSRLDTVCIVIDLEKRRRFLSLSLFFSFLSFPFFFRTRSSNRFDANEINGRGGGGGGRRESSEIKRALYEGTVIKGFRNILADKQTLWTLLASSSPASSPAILNRSSLFTPLQGNLFWKLYAPKSNLPSLERGNLDRVPRPFSTPTHSMCVAPAGKKVSSR